MMDNKNIENASTSVESLERKNFIREIIDEHLRIGKYDGRVHTRFPPEPNGYLHIGHAKSICLNFGLARDYGGLCNLRFDDTNPTKEEMEYVESIQRDIRWLGFDWEDRLYYASDYFERLYEFAEQLVRKGKAFVCDLTADEIREYRGTLTEPGKGSPYRNRSVEENLDLFRRMRKGEFPNGSRTLRAKIDMASPNLNMRDPVMYRILFASHHRTGDGWCIYPTYDWAHGQSDSIEGITHSICTLEFENHRPLYDWYLDELGLHHPQQIEFARLNLTYTVTSKRKLLKLVDENLVDGWDDPRMPTISGLRRRGYTPESIRNFADRIGVAKREYTADVLLLEDSLRNDLNKRAPRVMAVLRPLKVIIENYPDGYVEELDAVNNPEDPAMGKRKVSFSRVLYIEQDDFRENPPTYGNRSGILPYRNRSVEENLDLFRRMRKGEFPNGSRTLRAKIDMASPNLNMRDPVMYRILFASHHRTGDGWCIYPTYDWAHGQSDSIEGITHSICTLEFENHRPLYDWYLDELGLHHPQQIEFARLNLTYTVTSKRKLLKLVDENLVDGWDDPRMPTISGLRRRGYTPESIRNFADRIGVAKREYTADVLLLEDSLRNDLNKRAPRVMAVLRPLKVIIENYPDGYVEELDAVNNPEDPAMGKRKVSFSRVLYIEQDDFRENPPTKYFRLSPGAEVRLRYAYIIKCIGVVKDERTGEVQELRCTYDPETKSGSSRTSRKVKATIHWVSAEHAIEGIIRLYDRLFTVEDPEGENWKQFLNPNSLEVLHHCRLEPSLARARPQDRFQFERLGYFCVDDNSKPEALVFNRAVTLRDTWAKIEKGLA